MKLIKCYVEGFGKLKEFSYEFSDGMNVILEENGFGKTTLAAFLKAMFYGLAGTGKTSVLINERKRYKPWQGGNFGGNVLFEENGKRYLIERFFGEKDKDETFVLYDGETNLVSHDYGSNIGEELFLLDREAFERSVFMPQLKLETTGNDSLSAKLSNLVQNDNDMNHYEKALAALENKKKELLKTGEKGRIWELRHLISSLEYKLKELEGAENNLSLWENKRKLIKQRLMETEEQIEALQKDLKLAGEYEKQFAKREHYNALKDTQSMYEKNMYEKLLFFPEPMREELPDKQLVDSYFEQLDKISDCNAKLMAEKVRKESIDTRIKAAGEHYEQLKRQAGEEAKQADGALEKNKFSMFFLGEAVLGLLGIAFLFYAFVPGLLILMVSITALVITVIKAGDEKKKRDFLQREHDRKQQEKAYELKQAAKSLEMLREDALKCNSTCEAYKREQEELRKSVFDFIGQFDAYRLTEPSQYVVALSEIKERIAAVYSLRKDYERQCEAVLLFEKENDTESFRELTKLSDTLEVIQARERAFIHEKQQLIEQKSMIDRQIENLTLRLEEKEDDVSELEHAGLELAEAEKQYELLNLTTSYLEKAKDAFSVRYLDKMKERFSKYMELFNGENLGESVLDTKLKLKVTQSGSKKDPDCFSAGYRDLMNLCMRFALVDALYEKEKPFLILDDPFVNLDEKKLKNAMDFVKKLSASYQIIYFACHESRK